MTPTPAHLSRARTILFGVLAFVWFGEMMLWGFEPLSRVWTNVWHMAVPESPHLARALSMTHAIEAPAKGALGVMAVFALRSRDPLARTSLFASMALIPPLNIAFQFRAQGFPVRSIVVATAFTLILWGAFFLTREHDQRPRQQPTGGIPAATRRDMLRFAWFTISSAVLTLMALLFLLSPGLALRLAFPGTSPLASTSDADLASLVFASLGVGTHLLVVAIASWLATIFSRTNQPLRQALTAASIANAGLMCLLPWRRITFELGAASAAASLLVVFVPLLFGWFIYAALSAARPAIPPRNLSRT